MDLDELAASLPPEPAAASPAAPEAPKPETTAVEPAANAAPPAVDPEKPEAERPRGFMKRIDELTAHRRAAERERDALAEEVRQLKAQTTPAPAADAAPDPAKFGMGDMDPLYMAAVARHEARQAFAEEQSRLRQEAEAKSYDERRQAFLGKIKESDEGAVRILTDGNAPITRPMVDFILDSDAGVAVLDHLGRNYAEAIELTQLPPLKLGIALAKLESRLTAPAPAPVAEQKPPPRVSSAPPPIAPVGGSAPASDDFDPSMSQAAFRDFVTRKYGGFTRKNPNT